MYPSTQVPVTSPPPHCPYAAIVPLLVVVVVSVESVDSVEAAATLDLLEAALLFVAVLDDAVPVAFEDDFLVVVVVVPEDEPEPDEEEPAFVGLGGVGLLVSSPPSAHSPPDPWAWPEQAFLMPVTSKICPPSAVSAGQTLGPGTV